MARLIKNQLLGFWNFTSLYSQNNNWLVDVLDSLTIIKLITSHLVASIVKYYK